MAIPAAAYKPINRYDCKVNGGLIFSAALLKRVPIRINLWRSPRHSMYTFIIGMGTAPYII